VGLSFGELGSTPDEYSEMHGAGEPALVTGGALELRDLSGPGAELSTGLILTWRNRLVFGLEPRAIPLGARGQAGVSAFVGIGGHLDPGEGWGEAARREAMEEANCPVALADSPITYLCRIEQTPVPFAYKWDEPERPLLIWLATFNLLRGPQRQRTPVEFVNAVFRAAALGQPAPGAEVDALLLMDQEMLLGTYEAPQTFESMQARGVEVIGEPPPPDALLAPGGSAYFYAQWLVWQQ
jgi:8-oxo-dGTP pyrophosphatase MutT (NUDIX family)